MTQPNHYLAIDLGAESGRAMLGTYDGRQLQLSDVHRFANGPVRLPDGLHWDVLRLWTEIKSGIKKCVHELGVQPESIGLDTWGVDFGLLDRRGALLSNPYHYRDNRTDGLPELAFQRISRQRIFELTGIQFMSINTLYQLFALAVAEDATLGAAETFLTIPDLFNYWLTGVKACEFSIATTTQCYDPRRMEWSEPLLAALGIPRRIFPQVVMPGTALGRLLPGVAEETGAGPLQVIAPACHDTGSAVAAVPAEGERFAWISSGTWSIAGTVSDEPVITPASLKYNLTNEGGAANCAGAAGTFRVCKNIAGLWLMQECRRTWAAQGEELSYGELTDLAAAARPLVSLVDPDTPEFAKPGDMPGRIQAYCRRTGQPVPQSKGEIVRCVLESLALKYRQIFEEVDEIAGQRLEPLHIVGGGTRNRLLSQLSADATGRQVIAGPVEATAAGNILMQAIALGQISSLAEGRQVVRQSFALERYEPQHSPAWEDAIDRFAELIHAV